MAEITGITFKEGGKVYYFAPLDKKCEVGAGVIVETARGMEYGTVVIPREEVEDEKIVSPLKPILRLATAKDEEIHRKNLERKGEALQTVKEKVEKLGLEMKLIDCEFTFDGAKAVFYFSAPARVDFRELVKELSSVFRMRIEMRQVGIRDEIKMLGGLAPCGRECCCSGCMPEIKKVSIKMAKNQGLSLNPSKISGLCGRLMCCLEYENDYYAEAFKQMPKLGSEISTPDGKGTVVNTNMLKMVVRVKIEDKQHDSVTYKDYPLCELNGGCPCRADDETDDAEEADETVAQIAENNAVLTEKAEEKEKPAAKINFNGQKHKKNRENGENRGKKNGKGNRPNGQNGGEKPRQKKPEGGDKFKNKPEGGEKQLQAAQNANENAQKQGGKNFRGRRRFNKKREKAPENKGE